MWLYVPKPEEMPQISEDTITIADFCAGSGMLAIAIGAALELRGIKSKTLVHCEREACTAAACVGIEKASGSEALVYDDLTTFCGRRWRGIIDVATAGLPCPAYSAAGKKKGNSDARAFGENFDPHNRSTWGPVPLFLGIIDEMRPGVIFLENVSQWVTAGHFRPVRACLRAMGYQVQAPMFIAAEDVGAFHKRERVFILAYSPECQRYSRLQAAGLLRLQQGLHDYSNRPSGELAIGKGRGQFGSRESSECDGQPSGSGQDMGDSQCPHEGCGDVGLKGQEAKLGRSGSTNPSNELADSQVIGSGASRETDELRTPRESGCSSQRVATGLPLHAPARDIDVAAIARALAKAETPEEASRITVSACHLTREVWGYWEAIARMAPSYMPTIISRVPVVAPRLAGSEQTVQLSNSDLLRIGGNGICTLAASFSFGTLWDRVFLKGKEVG